MHKPTAQEILQTPISVDDPEIKTIGQYLSRNLHVIWIGLRKSAVLPHGNGLWESKVVRALVNAGHLSGTVDEFKGTLIYSEGDYRRLMESVFDLLECADYSTLALPPVPKDHYVVQLTTDGGIELQMVDFLDEPYTEEDAQKRVDELNADTNYSLWKAIHIPL